MYVTMSYYKNHCGDMF